MKKIIHIFGASGAGTTTLGKALKETYEYKQMDTDDYFWQQTNPPFTQKRIREERIGLMEKDITANEKVAITGSLSGWGDGLIPYFDLAVRVVTPTQIRINRLMEREYHRFGDRIRKGGDMYNDHLKFIEWASQYDTGDENMRSRAMHDKWVTLLECPLIVIDGTLSTNEQLEKIALFFEL